MAMPTFDSVDDYLDAQEPDIKKTLKVVRATIKKAIPKAEESVSYKIPTYKIDGTAVIFFAAWKKHWSLYPITAVVTRTLQKELAGHEVQKGTLKLPYDEKPPTALITKIAKLRAREERDR
jgi:uncharacterized protein YdhG (YjbR/CyaY superfamily)